jgi:hypothetical protein
MTTYLTSPEDGWRYSAELILIAAAKAYDWIWAPDLARPDVGEPDPAIPFPVAPEDLLPEEEAFVQTWPEDLRDDLRFSLGVGLLEVDGAGGLRVPAWLDAARPRAAAD